MGIDSVSRTRIPYEFLISERLVYPTLAGGASLISAAADWTLGAYATIIPASTISSDFVLHSVLVESSDVNGVMEMELYEGANDVLFFAWRFTIAGGYWSTQPYTSIGSPLIEADKRIRARLASSDGAANQATLAVSISYVIA